MDFFTVPRKRAYVSVRTQPRIRPVVQSPLALKTVEFSCRILLDLRFYIIERDYLPMSFNLSPKEVRSDESHTRAS
jgi:hypothetical protein